MSEKVILTKEQAEAIEWALSESDVYMNNPDELLSYSAFAGRQQDEEFKFKYELKPINDMKISQPARALYVGYKVELKYEVGDWIKRRIGRTFVYGQIDQIEFSIVFGIFSDGQRHGFHKSVVELMTPEEIAEEKERRFFARNNREPWRLLRGDILIDMDTGYPYIVTNANSSVVHLNNGASVADMKIIKDNYNVAAFAENRLDVKADG